MYMLLLTRPRALLISNASRKLSPYSPRNEEYDGLFLASTMVTSLIIMARSGVISCFARLHFKRPRLFLYHPFQKMTLGGHNIEIAPQEPAKPMNLRSARYVPLHSTLSGTVLTSLAARESHGQQAPQPTSNQSNSLGPKPTRFSMTLNPLSWVSMGFPAVGRPSCSIS